MIFKNQFISKKSEQPTQFFQSYQNKKNRKKNRDNLEHFVIHKA